MDHFFELSLGNHTMVQLCTPRCLSHTMVLEYNTAGRTAVLYASMTIMHAHILESIDLYMAQLLSIIRFYCHIHAHAHILPPKCI